jgi:hypothetical protein
LIAIVVFCASCWTMRSQQMADTMNSSDSFKLCLRNGVVAPDQFISCIRSTDAQSELDSCIPSGKHHEVMGCMDAQAKTPS